MPGLARKVLICAAIDGLLIQPLSAKGQKPFQPLTITYGDGSVSPASREQTVEDTDHDESTFEAFGIIGLITVSKLSYLISITRRQQVAQLFGTPIYVVTEVAITPCSSKAAAQEAIRKTNRHLEQCTAPNSASNDGNTSDDELESRNSFADEVDDVVVAGEAAKTASPRSSIAEDVIHRRGSYGRFASSWFSRSGWTQDQQKAMGISNSPTLSATEPPGEKKQDAVTAQDTIPKDQAASQAETSTLLPKLLRTVRILFGSSRSFYFSYDLDITRNMQKGTASPDRDAPLYEKVDNKFFWNRSLLQPFLSVGDASVVLPVMQGFVGQRTFTVDSNPPQVDQPGRESMEMNSMAQPETQAQPQKVQPAITPNQPEKCSSEKEYTISVISRRSVKRAGLRYLRRGINQEGNVANMVETEQLLMPADWTEDSTVHSFLQIRGSIPLFFTQSPYAIKPVPVLQYSEQTNREACRKHFESLARNYGAIQIVNLVEKHGVESSIGTRYEKTIEYLNRQSEEDTKKPDEKPLAFEWFDFHQACRGMKFENVSLLLSTLRGKLEEFGSTTVQHGQVVEKQKGVVRTNCMDCLDRTNVCQSSFARHMLDMQLKAEGFDMDAQVDQQTTWFNTLWADNGDAVSKQYASTAAMKGDYTRTKKRDYRGALNDLSLSLARFYSGMVNDYFSQTAIDFLLGNVNERVFEEFEADMMTKDPAISVTKLREQAIELCQKRVVADESEEIHGAWALISPHVSDTVKSLPMEEVVLLLTDAALYVCRFDWNMDKVSSFERVDLRNVTGIKLGTYITSTVSPSHMDASKNVGFVVTYQPGKADVVRTNTRTSSTRGEIAPSKDPEPGNEKNRPLSFVDFFTYKTQPPAEKKLAFKAPYVDSSTTVNTKHETELQQITTIANEIGRLTQESRLYKRGEEHQELIQKEDIISLEEAKKNTGLLEQLGHSIKRLVWA
ncbi:SacI domain protein [Emericellopsis atlantica]|uniref:SacI domain protein n=1 Tax=Emericellopsis atlantica TaxID=2614577 RepID=A0A9P8CLX1_9HYPO|nr:SacI domain protein [Emericellopsis atlantica]KAG9252074.1 SacI domain protein [Emericellopsis atlantica]